MTKDNKKNSDLRLIYETAFNEQISDIELEKLKKQILQLVTLSLTKQII